MEHVGTAMRLSFLRTRQPAVLLVFLLLLAPLLLATRAEATFSIVARDPETGEIGIAVQSRAFSVGSAVPWAEAGVGAIATQASTNESFGPAGLALLRSGYDAQTTLDMLPERTKGAMTASSDSSTRRGDPPHGPARRRWRGRAM